MSTTMRTFYAHSLSTIKGDQSVEDLKQEVVFTLCRVIANQPKLRGRSSSHFTTTQTEDQECPLITIEKMPKSVLPIDEKSASVVPPLQLSSLPTDPKLELVRTPNSEIVLKPNLVSPSDVAEIRVPPPSNPASSNSFPTLTSLKHSLLEKHISKTHEEKSETLFAKFRRLSISSKREVLDEKDPHEEQVERQASDIFYSKNEIITPHYQVVENRQRQKTEFEYCDDDTIPVKTARGSHHPSTMV